MEQELDYAQMLEIPVSTVSVVKKKSFFKRRQKTEEDLKDRVVESVNKRIETDTALIPTEEESLESVNDFMRTEDLSERPKTEEKKRGFFRRDKLSIILTVETVAACLIAGGIFLTNLFMPNSAINTFIGGLTAVEQKEASYIDFKLTSVVSDLTDAEVTLTDSGVLCFTEQTMVYPVCDGAVTSVIEDGGLYTVEIAHTSSFTSVITGLSNVYCVAGEKLASNLPFAYSDGDNEVRVSMYNGDKLLNCYSLSGVVPVWNS